MNFTLKNTARSVFAVIIALSMLLSIAMPAIAVTVDEIDRNKDDKINYVALGASNTNGFGLMGYLPDELYGNPISKMDGSVYGYLATPDNAYPSLVKDALAELTGKDVELAQLAISSMRAEELRFLLDETYEGDAYLDWRFYDLPEYPKSGNWFIGAGLQELGTTEATPEEALAALRAAYRDYIAAADVITIDIGANNFGVYASNRIFNNMFDNDFSRFDEEIQENVELFRAQVEKIVTENLGDYLPEDLGGKDKEKHQSLKKVGQMKLQIFFHEMRNHEKYERQKTHEYVKIFAAQEGAHERKKYEKAERDVQKAHRALLFSKISQPQKPKHEHRLLLFYYNALFAKYT